MSDADNKKCFNPFYYTYNSCSSCKNAINNNLPDNANDVQRGDKCVLQCQWIGWPLCFTLDVISCPFRGACHLQERYCQCNSELCKIYPVVDIQPL